MTKSFSFPARMFSNNKNQEIRTLLHTLEGVHIEALVLPDKARGLHLLLEETALGVIGGDDAVLLSLALELLSYFKCCSSLCRVLGHKFS